MKEVEYKLDDLLSMLVNNQNENKELKDNYIKMLDQINIYINELEEIKKTAKIIMSIVTVTLNNKSFQLYCNNGDEEKLLSLANKLNDKITEIKLVNPTASFELLLVMASLNAQAEIASITEKFEKNGFQKNHPDEEKFAETLTTIAGYLENLARKMGK